MLEKSVVNEIGPFSKVRAPGNFERHRRDIKATCNYAARQVN